MQFVLTHHWISVTWPSNFPKQSKRLWNTHWILKIVCFLIFYQEISTGSWKNKLLGPNLLKNPVFNQSKPKIPLKTPFFSKFLCNHLVKSSKTKKADKARDLQGFLKAKKLPFESKDMFLVNENRLFKSWANILKNKNIKKSTWKTTYLCKIPL